MKNTLLLIVTLISSFSFSQSTEIYTKNGYAINGYDVISYFKNGPVKGKEDYTTTYKGVKFKFSSKENLGAFKQNPSKYEPQFGGWCAYAVAKNNENVKIDPKSYFIKGEKLYLFYDSWFVDTKKKWNKNEPDKLRKQAHSNWNKREKATN